MWARPLRPEVLEPTKVVGVIPDLTNGFLVLTLFGFLSLFSCYSIFLATTARSKKGTRPQIGEEEKEEVKEEEEREEEK